MLISSKQGVGTVYSHAVTRCCRESSAKLLQDGCTWANRCMAISLSCLLRGACMYAPTPVQQRSSCRSGKAAAPVVQHAPCTVGDAGTQLYLLDSADQGAHHLDPGEHKGAQTGQVAPEGLLGHYGHGGLQRNALVPLLVLHLPDALERIVVRAHVGAHGAEELVLGAPGVLPPAGPMSGKERGGSGCFVCYLLKNHQIPLN